MSTTFHRLLLITLPLLLAACATTPQSRIEKNPAAFAALSPEQQQKVQGGVVSVGFDAAAVELALGKPDRILERETAEGATQTWVYYAVIADRQHAGFCGASFPYYGYAYHCGPVVVTATQYEERTRVIFKEGAVVSVERAR